MSVNKANQEALLCSLPGPLQGTLNPNSQGYFLNNLFQGQGRGEIIPNLTLESTILICHANSVFTGVKISYKWLET